MLIKIKLNLGWLMPYQIQLYNAKPSYSIICYIRSISPLHGKTINYIELHRVLLCTSSTVENCYRNGKFISKYLYINIPLYMYVHRSYTYIKWLAERNTPVKWFIWGHLKSSLATFSHNKWSTSSIIMY